MPRPALPTAAAALALAVVLTGCTGSDGPDGPDGSGPAVQLPELEPTWTATLPTGSTPLATDVERRGRLTAFPVGDALVVVGTRTVTSLGADGDELWTWSVPPELGTVCDAAPPGDGGVTALAFAPDDVCSVVGGLDVADGSLLWSRDVGPQGPRFVGFDVWAGAQTLAVAGGCITSRRYDLRTGAPLQVIAAPSSDRVCDVDVQLRDGLGAVYDHSRGARGGEPTLALLDLETGEPRWERPADFGSELEGIVSTDPVVLDYSEAGRRTLRAYDDRGEPGPYLGPEVPFDGGVSSPGVVDGVLVGQYSLEATRAPAGPYVGTDVGSGDRRWRVGPEQTWVLGGTSEALVAIGGAGAGESSGVDEDGWLTLGLAAYDDPTTPVGLGRVQVGADTTDGSAGLGWADGWLLVQRDTELSAFALPDPDTWADLPALPPAPDPGWEDDDVRPGAAADLCEAVTPTTLASLGVQQEPFPLPGNCHLRSGEPSDHALKIDAITTRPADGSSAVDGARDELESARGYLAPGEETADLDDLGDLADEAWISAPGTSDIGEVEVIVAARHRNVVLEVSFYARGGRAESLDPDALRTATIEATREALTELADRAR